MATEFLVIGGGIAGISAAARLSHLGRVTLLEMESALGYHASGRSAALFEQNYGSETVVQLSRASADYHANAHGGVLSDRGLLIVGQTSDKTLFAADCDGLGATELSVDEARDIVPILDPKVVQYAAFHRDAFDIDTDLQIQNFRREARENGADVLTGMQVTAIRRIKAGWRVSVGEQVFEARVLVNAAGAWADQIATLAGIEPIGLVPHRRSMARIPAPGGLDVSRWPMMLGAGERWYAKPDAGMLLVSPAEEHPTHPHDAWPEDMVLAEGLARYEEFVTEPITRLVSSWAGLRTFAPDRALVLGPDPLHPNFVWVAGQGGYGFQSAPAASQLVADLIAGRPPDLDTEIVVAMSPARFR